MQPLLVLTIGQSPRPDIVAELTDAFADRSAEGPASQVPAFEVQGALDGLAADQIAAMPPISAADTLHTRLPNGTDVVVSKKEVTSRLGALIEQAGDRPTLVACTGTFDGLPERPNLLFPSRVLDGLIDAVLPNGHQLGVLVPLADQIGPFTESRGRPDRPATVVAVTPGSDPTEAATELREAGVDLIVLDCFGYDRELLATVRAVTGKPVLSAVRATAALAAELTV